MVDGISSKEVVVPDFVVVTHPRHGPRVELSTTGRSAPYAVRFEEDRSYQWSILTARNRALPVERADVDATPREMDAAECAALEAYQDWRAEDDDEGPDANDARYDAMRDARGDR